jgi:TP901 family phage tail tape measure protein
MQKLDGIAKQMGTSSMYSAQDAAAAMLELSKSGATAGQMAAGELKSTMLMAAAGELELGSAAETTANTLNMFGLKANQANQVANALAGGANASSASVDSLRQALSQVGPGASNAGLSRQMTTGILAAFANKGIQGSDAGTSLKTMLTRLIPTTDTAAKAMKRYGLDFTDTHGRILPMTQVAQQLQDRLGKLTMEQRNAALSTIFGSDATRAATVLMQEGASGIKDYVKATSDRSAASKMAAAQERSDSGQNRKAMAALKTAAVDVQDAMAPMVRWVAAGISKIAKAFSAAPAPVQKLAVALGFLLAAAGPVSLAFGGLAKGGGFAFRTVSSLTMAFGKGGAAAPAWARGVAGATKGAVNGIRRLSQGFRDSQAAESAFSGRMGTLGGKLRKAFDKAKIGSLPQRMGDSFKRWGSSAASAVGKGFADSKDKLRALLQKGTTKAASGLKVAVSAVASVGQVVATKALAAATAIATAAQWSFNAAMAANPIVWVVVAIVALVAVFVVLWKKCAWFRDFWKAVWREVVEVAKAVWVQLRPAIEAIWNGIKVVWGAIWAATKWVWARIGPFVMSYLRALWAGAKQILTAIVAAFRWPGRR